MSEVTQNTQFILKGLISRNLRMMMILAPLEENDGIKLNEIKI